MESTFVLSNLPFVPPTLPATSAPSQPTTIKLEDLETISSMAASEDSPMSEVGSPGSPSADLNTAPGEQKSSPKKRRSWGQVLPEPKTNLPPRKRAKTADEKEQRRIERVKRNRLAAHNSRERKRQEVEALQSEKQELEQKLQMIQDYAEQQEAQLRYFRQMFPDAVAGAPFVAPKSSLDTTLHRNPFASFTSSSAVVPVTSSNAGSHGSPCSQSLPASANATPDSLAQTLDTFSMPSTPCAEPAPGADMTQHSAVSVSYQESPFLGHGDFDLDSGKPLLTGFGDGIHPTHLNQHDNFLGNLGVDFGLFNNEPLFPDTPDLSLFPTIASSTSFFEPLPEGDSVVPADEGGSFDGMFADTLAGSGATVSVSDEPGIASA